MDINGLLAEIIQKNFIYGLTNTARVCIMGVYIESEVFYMRINITMDEELVKKIDEVASKMYVSRSAYIAFAVSQKIQADKLMEYMPELTQTMKSAVELEKRKTVDGSLLEDGDGGEA